MHDAIDSTTYNMPQDSGALLWSRKISEAITGVMSDAQLPEDSALTVNLVTDGTSLSPSIFSRLQTSSDRNAYLRYSNESDVALRELCLQRWVTISARLEDREKGTHRRPNAKDSKRKVKFLLNSVEKESITATLLAQKWTLARYGSARLKQLVYPLGGSGCAAFGIIVAKWVENNAKKLFLAAGTTEDEWRQMRENDKVHAETSATIATVSTSCILDQLESAT